MLGIIIINYNTYEKTVDCVDSIKRTYNGDYKIYLLDNASNNESAQILEGKYTDDDNVRLVISDKNLGYARGNNLCLKMAKEDGCKYVVISNNDIVYKDRALEFLLDEIQKEDVLLVGPKVIHPGGDSQKTVKYKAPSFIEYRMFETYASAFFKKQLAKRREVPTSAQDVYWIAGCTFIVDVEKFEKIGFFDEYTFLYFEEYIISEKAKSNNLRLRYCPRAEVLHYHGYSMGGALNITTRSANWKSEIYFVKNYWHWNRVKCWILWHMRVLEIKFNARKEYNKEALIEEYKIGRKYL